jgi:hypothetical protein
MQLACDPRPLHLDGVARRLGQVAFLQLMAEPYQIAQRDQQDDRELEEHGEQEGGEQRPVPVTGEHRRAGEVQDHEHAAVEEPADRGRRPGDARRGAPAHGVQGPGERGG